MEHILPQRWVARPVEVEAVVWTGSREDLPLHWRVHHPHIRFDEFGLAVTTIEQDTGRPEIGDYLVWGTASEIYWSPPEIHEARHKHVGDIRWVALPVETEAVLWTGRWDDLPTDWQADLHLRMEAGQLALTNYRDVVTWPRAGLDYIVQRGGGKFSKVPRAIWEFKYEQVTT